MPAPLGLTIGILVNVLSLALLLYLLEGGKKASDKLVREALCGYVGWV